MEQTKVLIKNIKALYLADENIAAPLVGSKMKDLPFLENAYLAVEGDHIVGYGLMEDWEGITDWNNLEIIDADNQIIYPTYCDSHTHMVFANSREEEFEDRIKGLSYEEIAQRGGGILNSAKALQQKDEDTLFQEAKQRLDKLIKLGTGAIEIKSGYGLTKDAELKMLRVAKRLQKEMPIPIKTTFLGAHAIPPEYKEKPDAYVDLIINEMLPAVAEEKLADYIDAFCEKGYFTAEQTERVIDAGAKYGLKAKIHVNQFNAMGGVELCCKKGAISVDHLEILTDKDIAALKNSSTMAVGLPSCSFFLGLDYTDGKKLISENIPLAIASDFNPGSTPSGNMNFVFSLACVKMKLLPTEALAALTINGAKAMELDKEVGSISVGKKANFIITKPVKNLAYIPYSFGENNIDKVFINGKEYK
ncbi:imidazolonepropionase [Luteibaculum oceani]|uniref:Imidazolonepropionase n=1 Tax=Luteibaculum oceani TaxID=1294296 RepID=A0A5C6V7V6_9FLAO|nr:imidazolonepropionase [Luteibaculum oceani]TXC81352.1 imidazolonepropionase [Luteibaculum oceani]